MCIYIYVLFTYYTCFLHKYIYIYTHTRVRIHNMMQQPATCRASASAAPKRPPGPKPEWDHGSPNPAIGKPWLEPKKKSQHQHSNLRTSILITTYVYYYKTYYGIVFNKYSPIIWGN